MSCGLMSDLIKLVLTSYDDHLSHGAVLCRPTPIFIRAGITKQVNKWNLVLLVVKQWRQA